MNPNQSPNDGFRTDPSEHPQYDIVLKMILWGEKREDVYHRMSVNGLTGEGADVLFQHAWADRLQTIRAVYFRRLMLGIALFIAAGIVFVGFWYGLKMIPKTLLYGCFVAWAIGIWKFVDGITGYLMAHKKEGSVAEEF